MMTTWRIAMKEFRGLVNSPVAYIFMILFVVTLAGTYFYWGYRGHNFFAETTTEMDEFFSMLPLAFVLLVPALSMKLWPDELKSGTVEIFLTYPVRSWQVVLGKFLAGLLLIVASLLCTLAAPLVVSHYGPLDWGPVIGAYLGGLLLGAAFLSVGVFMGALCKEQVSAFILTASICLLFVLLGDNVLNAMLPREVGVIPVHLLSEKLSFTSRFVSAGRGVLNLADLIYFLSFTVMFLVLNVAVIECRKGK